MEDELVLDVENRRLKYNGECIGLNSWLVDNKNLSDEEVLRILQLHLSRLIITKEMEIADPSEWKAYALAITEVSFRLQDAWNFSRDESLHRWFDIPHCKCPILDNEDNMGFPDMVIINGSCPIHGE